MTPPAGVDISVPHKSSLSATDMLKQGREYRANMDKAIAELQALVEQAKKQKDVIRLNCVMDKLMQVKVNMNMADEALQKLQEAAGRRDDSASLHEYTRITIVNQKVQVLQNEGQTCVGAELNYIGATRVEVEAPEVAENMTEPSLEPPPLERPNAATNFTQ
jgi:flagellar biosynthesis component FlhA